jgi:hypothetical protein
MAKKYNNDFHSKALQNIPKLGFLVWKCTIWQPFPPLVLRPVLKANLVLSELCLGFSGNQDYRKKQSQNYFIVIESKYTR